MWFIIQASFLICPPTTGIHFMVVLQWPPNVHTPWIWLSCNPRHGNLMGSDPLTMVVNSAHCHDQSISQRNAVSDSVWWPNHNHRVFYHAGNTYNITFTEEHFLQGLRVHFSKGWHEHHRDVSTITIPYAGVSSTVNSVAGEMGLTGEQNVTNLLGISINKKKYTGSIYECTVNDVITSYMHTITISSHQRYSRMMKGAHSMR